MKIKTQFIVCLIVFSVVLLIIAASVARTEQQVSYLNTQQEISHTIEREASSLNGISIDYFLYQEDLQTNRWNTTLSLMFNDLEKIEANNPEQAIQLNTVATDLQELNEQFANLTVYLQNAPRNVSVRIDPAFQFRWSGMALQGQTLASDVSQLSHSLNDQANQVNGANTLLILSLVITFGAFLATIYLMVFRKTLKSVTTLQNGINTIGTGNLDYTINVEGENEITQLSRAFNQMTTNLKNVTASKADLECEITERKRVEESLQKTQEKLEESAVQLEEYTSQLEELAEQRANKLKDAERLAAIGATAGMVGHDIRNPLQAITGDLYLAKTELAALPETELKANTLESLDEIEKNVDYINKIVADLQDYARPLNPRAREANIESIFNEVLGKNNIPENIGVIVDVDEEAQKIMADPDYLKRIFTNLTLNAVQAMPDGGKLTIRSYTDKQTNDILITVKDTGVGIPEDIKPKLFTPMMTTKSKGQGFGLAVVKRMTEGLGGTVTFESTEGKGTTFIVRLPPPKS